MGVSRGILGAVWRSSVHFFQALVLEILWEWPGLFWDAAGIQAMFNHIQNFNCGDSLASSKQNQANVELDEMLKN